MSADSAVAIAWDLLKGAVTAIKRPIRYVMSSKSFADSLQEEVQSLDDEVRRVNVLAEQASNNVRKFHDVFTRWEKKSDDALKEVRDLLGNFENATKTCCYGNLPDPKCRYQFSRKAEGKIKVIRELAEKFSGFKELNDISFSDTAPGNVTATNPTRREGKDVVQSTTATASASSASTSNELSEDGVFESRTAIIRDIMGALADNSNSVVGVYGMGGVGKSTLLDDVVSRIREEKRFDLVAKADVSQNPDIKRIQSVIAHALGLDMKDYEYESMRADRLRERLGRLGTEEKKVLIILDNLWKGLDLKSVGIPCGHDNKAMGCKLLLTSRDQKVLRREMGCDKDFFLDKLEKKEAKILFERMVGDKVHKDEFRPLVNEALRKCEGLPLLIVTMAKHFKDAPSSDWRDDLNQIELSTNEGISGVINKMLQLSYDHLECNEAKRLLQLCVAYGVSEPSNENLVRYGYGWGIFQKDSSMKDARVRLSKLIHTLQASSLLLENGGTDGFKIHDLVRNFVALFIFKDHPLLVLKDKDTLATQMQKERLESCTTICFPYIAMEELPKELDCPEMRIFLLFNNNEFIEVPDSYFNSMRKLAVLNLTRVHLTSSPTPFQSLENLCTLSLQSCSLENVAILGELKGLQILSFVNSKIERLPKEIGQLTKLRLLDLNNCLDLQIIEPGVLGRLIKLEELYMENSFNQWNSVGQTQPTNASLIELNHLKNLCTLHLFIPDPSVVPEDLDVKKLTKYKIRIGNAMRWSKDRGLRILYLELDPISDVLRKGWLQSILNRTDDLFLAKFNGSEQNIYALSQEGFSELKHLLVKDSLSIDHIFQWHSDSAFEMLESLLLEKLIILKKICYGHNSSKSFGALKVIQVRSCDNMEVLFPLSLLRGFPQLEEIEVAGCKLMHRIVEADDCGKVELRNLRVLKLCNLPNIKNFFTAGTTPSTSTLDDQVGTPIAFFNGQQISIPSLESLTMERLPNMEEIWSNESPLELSNLRSLQVMLCKSLLKVINFGSLVKLHKLHYLCIIDCNSVEEIFDLDGTNADGDFKTLSSELTTLELYNLGSLRCIWNKNPCGRVSFLRLERLEVHNCPNLKFMFFPSMVKSLRQLRDLSVKHCKKMEAIIIEEEGLRLETSKTLVFPILTSLNLQHLESLMCFSCGKRSREARSQDRIKSSSNALFCQQVAFPSLETLNITGLDNIEMIWDNQVVEDSFPKLKSLFVDKCNKVVTVVPSSILGQLLCLESLKANTCGSLEVVFELGPLNSIDGPQVVLPLKKLMVSRLPKLKCVWKKELHHQVNFQYLHSISVSECKSLTSLFPASVTKDLVQLEELEINECGILELIEKEEGLLPTFDFPKLTSLKLKHLTELKCIYTETHALHWPTLKTLQVYGCNKLEIFASQLENEMLLHKQPLFLIEKVGFQSLGALEINGLDNLKFLFFPSMVKSLAQLKKLTISDCEKMEAIFMEEEGLGMETSEFLAFQMLIDLRLKQLNSLTCFSRGKCVRESQSQDCVRSHATTLFNQEVVFPNLEKLSIEGMDKIETIWDDQIPTDSFSKLRLLSMNECKKLVHVVPSFILGRLLSLEILKAKACASLEVIFKLQPLTPLDGNSVARSPLKELKLNELSKLNCVWDKELYHHIKFQCLRLVTLQGCTRLTSLFSASIARDLIQLGKLEINQCGIVELIEKQGPNELSINVEAIEGPSHGLKVASSFPSYFQHLKTLDVSCCHGLSNMFTPTMATNLVELTTLRISRCEILTEVISDEEGGEGHVVAFDQLKYMELDGLIGLRSFNSGGYTLIFPVLEDIIVTRCPNMKFFSQGPIEASKLKKVQVSKEVWFWAGNLNITIQNMFEEMDTYAGVKKMLLSEFPELIGKWHNKLHPIKSHWQLESMVVDKCPFINAIPSRLIPVLDNLSFLQVRDCKLLEEIFDLEGLEVVESTRVLPQLCELNLANLPKLRQLWNKDLQESIHFDSLCFLILYNCSNLGHAFASSMARCLANLEKMEIKECGQMEGVIIEEEGQGSAMEKITFPKLRQMKLECLPNLTCLLLGKNHSLECPKLTVLSITHCPKMRSLTRQSWMENVHNNPSLFTPQVQFPKLWRMDLSHMDNLSKIWTNTPQETLTFDCLRKVEVRNCKGLENLFPYWVATSLTHLEKLQVESCEIEEIVTNGGDTPRSNTTQDLFPKLTSLVLRDMPRLKSFYPNLPTLHWPLLEELRVTHCDKLNMLSFTASMNSWAQKYDQQDLSNQEVHSSFERDFPNFKRLLLVNNNIQMIQDGNFPDDFFSKPKALTLACFHDEKAAFPSIFLLERFRNLQSLEVFCSSFEDIFPNEGLVEEGKHSVLENLREIKLNKLHNLKRVWREDSLVSKILQSIETFEIWDCPCLTTIFPTVASFHNLTELVVKNSSGLVHLVTVSTVTNLMHLDTMTIIGCKRMKEVVANDGNGEGKVISFGNLSYLTLQDLPSLECFSSILSCTFKFPWLHSIEVEECPKMKTFFKGTLSTPKLSRRYGSMSLFRYKWLGENWEEGDHLNTTIQKLSA